jgi:hypothetical protein
LPDRQVDRTDARAPRPAPRQAGPVRAAGASRTAPLARADQQPPPPLGPAGGVDGRVTVGTCIGTDRERRRAERTLADLVGTFEGNIETRVSRATVEEFLTRYGPAYDLVILGASRDRSAASRFVSRPTFERIDGDEGGTDIAILDRR